MLSHNLLLAGDDGYNLTKSLRFRSSASAYLNRTPASTTNRQIWTWSAWLKQGNALNSIFSTNASDNNSYNYFGFSSDSFRLYQWNGGSYDFQFITTAVYRDPSAWYHFVIQVDTTQATAANRVRLYVNGVQVTALSTNTTPSQNLNTYVNNSSYSHLLARNPAGSSTYFDGYLTEVNFIDGQALTPSSFGETDVLTGVWKPKKYAGTYGTNGFYLPFTNTTSTSTLGNDFSGNSNTWTVNNISLTAGSAYDSMIDVPTLTSATTANYAVWNPLVLFPNTTYQATMSNANMLMTRSGGGQGGAATTIGVTSGKFYAEMPVTAVGGSVTRLGVMATNDPPSISAGSEYALGDTSASVAYRSNGARLTGGTTTNSWGSTYTTGDVIGLAFDANTGKVWLGKQTGGTGSMVWQASGDPAAGTNQAATLPTGVPFYFSAGGESGISISLNCGQQPWSATPPTGFVALNTFNLPTSTIVKGGSVMTAYTWSGNSTEPRAFTDVGFKPDFYWSKVRNAGSSQHILIDSVRGVNGQLSSDNTDAEDTTNFAVKFDSFDANGFTLSKGSNATFGYYQGNLTGRNYVGWMWQAGQGTTSSNTAGSITSTVSANTSAGFSVVTYTGTGSAGVRIGHGLGVAPRMMIVKQRGGTTNWAVYHASLPSAFGIAGTQVINLNTTSANTQNFDVWESNNPEATVFSVGASTLSNANGGTYVAYCFAQIAGYSAFGSYTGNGSADGVFVHLGFRPRFLMIKRTDTGGTDWVLLDSSRDPTNVVDQYLAANLSDAEAVYANDKVDFLSNGFKQRGTASGQNGSGGTFIYMAFAENPFKNSLAR